VVGKRENGRMLVCGDISIMAEFVPRARACRCCFQSDMGGSCAVGETCVEGGALTGETEIDWLGDVSSWV
jgi:hypothetical protein